MTELKSLTPTEKATWDSTRWSEEWATAFGETIRDEIRDSSTPITLWTVTGRKTRENPFKENMGWWSLAGVDLSLSYARWRYNNPSYRLWVTPDGKPGNELEFIQNFGSVPVKVIIDRVYVLGDQLVVVDLKSGTSTPEDILQLCVYAAAIELRYGIRPTLGAYFMNRKGNLAHLEDLSPFTTEMIVDLMEGFVKQRELGVYLPNPGRRCNWCEAAADCPWGDASAVRMRSN